MNQGLRILTVESHYKKWIVYYFKNDSIKELHVVISADSAEDAESTFLRDCDDSMDASELPIKLSTTVEIDPFANDLHAHLFPEAWIK